jgi:hypothetical protein
MTSEVDQIDALADVAGIDSADLLARGVARLLADLGYSSLSEFTLRSGRRADVAAIDRKGRILIVEIKRSLADFRSDGKWPEYIDYCDAFYFAVPQEFPRDVLPDEPGLMLADRYGAAIIRPARDAAATSVHASRRREVLVRFGVTAANRLQRLNDPDGAG